MQGKELLEDQEQRTAQLEAQLVHLQDLCRGGGLGNSLGRSFSRKIWIQTLFQVSSAGGDLTFVNNTRRRDASLISTFYAWAGLTHWSRIWNYFSSYWNQVLCGWCACPFDSQFRSLSVNLAKIYVCKMKPSKGFCWKGTRSNKDPVGWTPFLCLQEITGTSSEMTEEQVLEAGIWLTPNATFWVLAAALQCSGLGRQLKGVGSLAKVLKVLSSMSLILSVRTSCSCAKALFPFCSAGAESHGDFAEELAGRATWERLWRFEQPGLTRWLQNLLFQTALNAAQLRAANAEPKLGRENKPNILDVQIEKDETFNNQHVIISCFSPTEPSIFFHLWVVTFCWWFGFIPWQGSQLLLQQTFSSQEFEVCIAEDLGATKEGASGLCEGCPLDFFC